MRLSIITDEISSDPETAIELGIEWGVRDFELRGVGSDRVPLLSGFQKDRLRDSLDRFDARLIAISPGLFKCPFPRPARERLPMESLDHDLHRRWQKARDVVSYHTQELLPLSVAFAKEFGAEVIVAFSFQKEGDEDPVRDEILEVIRQAAETAGESHLRLAIEVEDGFWADTGARAARIIEGVNHPALGINWDPANAYVAGDTPYPDGYREVRRHVRHVHFKDVERSSGDAHRYVTQGVIDWRGQIEALAEDHYDGYISVETHMQPKVQAARAMTERLQNLIEGTRKTSRGNVPAREGGG
jgi:sugar phosphate isomerase/epimerase